MASKNKDSKTSKTAHVLNLLAGDEASSEPMEADMPATEVNHGIVAPILEVARENDDAISDAILAGLQADEAAEADPPAPPAAVEKPAAVKAPAAAAEEPASPVQTAPPISESVPAVPVPDEDGTFPNAETARAAAQSAPEMEYCNVTEKLVDEKALKYIRMFDICTCPRCVADVKALALTKLPPRYIVMSKSDLVPMLSFYEEKMDTEITTQLITACRTVQAHPRH